MWLLFLKRYWLQVAIVLAACVTVLYFHHTWYAAGYSASQAKISKQHDADVAQLEKDRDTAFRLLHEAGQELATEKAAKDAALKQASKTPEVLIKEVHDKDTNCIIPSIGPDFERVWNAQSQAAAAGHKPVP